MNIDFDTLRRQEPDRGRLHDVFSRLEFASLMQEYLPEAPPVEKDFRIAGSAEDVREFVAAGGGGAPLGIWVESKTPDGFDEPMAISISTRPAESLIVPPPLFDALRDVLASDRVFVAHDAKLQSRRLHAAGWPLPQRWEDTMLMSYVINPGLPSHSLGNVARDRLKQDILSRKDVQKTAPLFAVEHEIGSSELGAYQQYLGEKSEVTMALQGVLEPELRRDPALVDIYQRIELPLSPVLARMEERGIRIDVNLLHDMSATMGAQIAGLESRIYKEAGTQFNINSPSQLGHILFEKLNYPVLKKTKTKQFSTSMDVLEELASHGFVIPQLILEHRELHKLKSTYVDALPQLVGNDGRVHTSFNQAVAATGRL